MVEGFDQAGVEERLAGEVVAPQNRVSVGLTQQRVIAQPGDPAVVQQFRALQGVAGIVLRELGAEVGEELGALRGIERSLRGIVTDGPVVEPAFVRLEQQRLGRRVGWLGVGGHALGAAVHVVFDHHDERAGGSRFAGPLAPGDLAHERDLGELRAGGRSDLHRGVELHRVEDRRALVDRALGSGVGQRPDRLVDQVAHVVAPAGFDPELKLQGAGIADVGRGGAVGQERDVEPRARRPA